MQSLAVASGQVALMAKGTPRHEEGTVVLGTKFFLVSLSATLALIMTAVGGAYLRIDSRLDDANKGLATLGERIAKVETRLDTFQRTAAKSTTELSTSVGELDQKIVEGRAAIERELAELKKRQNEASMAVARAQQAEDVARKSRLLVDVRATEARLLATLPPQTMVRTTTGFFRAHIPGENQLVLEDADGRTVGFRTTPGIQVYAICGSVTDEVRMADLQARTPILVAFVGSGSDRQAHRVARSSCA
jgi:hypothetical protein